MKKWLVIILLLSVFSVLEASSVIKRVHRLPPLVGSKSGDLSLSPLSSPSTKTVDLEESLESLSASTGSSLSSTLSTGLSRAFACERKTVFIKAIVWQESVPSSTEKDYYFEKKHKGFFSLEYVKDNEDESFPFLDGIAQVIESLYRKGVKDIFLGVPIEPVKPIESYSVRKYRGFFCIKTLCSNETLEVFIEYCERYGPLHIILSSD